MEQNSLEHHLQGNPKQLTKHQLNFPNPQKSGFGLFFFGRKTMAAPSIIPQHQGFYLLWRPNPRLRSSKLKKLPLKAVQRCRWDNMGGTKAFFSGSAVSEKNMRQIATALKRPSRRKLT
ncbi:hypothetical protein M9H77_01422 [Catharanthus roseus]|nr:hypothetical protein M9H77_01420 [Catharanthus roseus]KAI5680195.1 hypothetical protein M9H77_01422 [Catharanthus roseus]